MTEFPEQDRERIDFRIYSQEVKAFLLLMLETPPDPEVHLDIKEGSRIGYANYEFTQYINKARGLLKMRIPISLYKGQNNRIKKRMRDIRAVTNAFKADLLQAYWEDKQAKAQKTQETKEPSKPRYDPLKLSITYWIERERQKALERQQEIRNATK